MRALVLDQPHAFRYEDRPMPKPGPGEALVRVEAVAVCGSDIHAINGAMPLFSFPRVLGHEIAATVMECNQVEDLFPGDRVCVMPAIFCRSCIACRKGKTNCCVSLKLYGVQVDGGLQEYMAVPGGKLLKAPEGSDYTALSLIEPLAIGAHAISRITVEHGDRVLVLGSGPIGVCCALMAKTQGADVILADVSPGRAGFVQERFGFPVLNPLDQAYGEALGESTGGELFHAVIDTTAHKQSMDSAYTLIGHGGHIIFVGMHKGRLEIDEAAFHMKEPTLAVTRNSTRHDFEHVMRLWAEGKAQPEMLRTDIVEFANAATVLPEWAAGKDGLFKGIVRVYNGR